MSIKYEIQSIKNVQGTGKQRYFVRVFEQSPRSTSQIEQDIQDNSSLTKGDVKAALSAMNSCITLDLSQGRRFHIPGLGYFSLSVGIGANAKDDIAKLRGNGLHIRNIKFRPEASLLNVIRENVRFERSSFTSVSRTYTKEDVKSYLQIYLTQTAKCITRRTLQSELGLRPNMAQKWLRHLVAMGFLVKAGARTSPVYFLNEVSDTSL